MIIECYRILQNCFVDELEKEIKQLIREGWQPFGYPYFGRDPDAMYIQAMVKYRET